MSNENHNLLTPAQKRLIEESLLIEQQEAIEAGSIGYMARVLTQATLPHRDPKKEIFRRSNGALTVSIVDTHGVGLPYGALPRLLLAWVTTEAVLTKEKRIVLGDSLSSFMEQLGIVPTGGRWGSITRLKEQLTRLFGCSIGYKVDDGRGLSLHNTILASDMHLWWDAKNPDQTNIWESYVDLSYEFFTEITERPVPIDMRALEQLRRSPMAIDIYNWLTYRMSYLKKNTAVSWEQLQMQFGAAYGFDDRGKNNFQQAFKKHLKSVMTVYPEANVDTARGRLILKPSKPHVAKLKPAKK